MIALTVTQKFWIFNTMEKIIVKSVYYVIQRLQRIALTLTFLDLSCQEKTGDSVMSSLFNPFFDFFTPSHHYGNL
jgi:hypothetical protein